MSKELKVTQVSFEDFTAYDYICQAAFYFKDALGNVIMLHSSKREECQAWVDEHYPPKGKYTVIASRTQKNKSKLESGLCSATGTSTRRGQHK
jgi:hypothetical protein